MPLYTRADFESDMMAVDRLSVLISGRIAAGTLDGVKAMTLYREVDRLRELCTAQLARTRFILSSGKRKPQPRESPPDGMSEGYTGFS